MTIFEGPIYDAFTVSAKLAKSAVAVAMYQKETDTFTYYADPTKLKTYLAIGLPVLLTDVPYNAEDIVAHECGKIVRYDAEDIAIAIIEMLENKHRLRRFRRNAINYARQFDWNPILSKNLMQLLESE